MGEAVRVDLIHWIEIGGLTTKGYGLLILLVYPGSNGWEPSRTWGRRRFVAGELFRGGVR